MTTEITANGSKWAGECADPIDALIRRLEMFALDRRFEAYGNFVITLSDEPCGPDRYTKGQLNSNATRFWGNFADLSAVFQVDTDEPELIERLTTAIRENQRRADYLAQPTPEEQREVASIRWGRSGHRARH